MVSWRQPLVLAAILLAGGHAGVCAQSSPRSIYLEARSVDSGIAGTATTSMKMWSTAQSMRADVTHPLAGSFRLLVFKGNAYMLQTASKTGFKMPVPDEIKGSVGDLEKMVQALPGVSDRISSLPPRIREETLLGYPCDVHSASKQAGAATTDTTIWMPKTLRPRIPLRVIERKTTRQEGATIRETRDVTVTKLQLNVPVTEALFSVPDGYQLQERGADSFRLPGLGGRQ